MDFLYLDIVVGFILLLIGPAEPYISFETALDGVFNINFSSLLPLRYAPVVFRYLDGLFKCTFSGRFFLTLGTELLESIFLPDIIGCLYVIFGLLRDLSSSILFGLTISLISHLSYTVVFSIQRNKRPFRENFTLAKQEAQS